MDSKRIAWLVLAALLGCAALLYLGGVAGQLLNNYSDWLEQGGMTGQVLVKPIDFRPSVCYPGAFTVNGLKGMAVLVIGFGGLFVYIKLHDRFEGKEYDPRGFKRSKYGLYGTASWMTEAEMKAVLEITTPGQAEGTILGEYDGKAVCMPKDTRLNRHIAVFGASGTMKSRAVIRNALFQTIKRGESAIITDSKGELYADTAELFRKNGYEVRVYNLVDPEHSDSWNCMSELHGDTLTAQVLTNVIIGNTSSGKGDHFWDSATRSPAVKSWRTRGITPCCELIV